MGRHGGDFDVLSSPVADRNNCSDVDYAALKSVEPEGFESWNDLKKQAWNQLDTNPNAFLYRYTLPGEEKKNGPWSDDEKQHFIKVLQEHPPDKAHWGMFSKHIPGRVGYQCNAFYKKLISLGEIDEATNQPKEDGQNTDGDSNNGEQKAKPLKKSKKNYVEYDGDQFAFNYNMINSTSFHFLPPNGNDDVPTFHEILLDSLKNTDIMQRFMETSNPYFKVK